MVQTISHSDAVSLVHKLLSGQKIFSVTNVKADGSLRKYVVCPKAFRSQIKGTGKPLDAFLHPHLVRVPDTTANGWRTINLRTLVGIKASGHELRVID